MKTPILTLTCWAFLIVSGRAADETTIATPKEMLIALAEARGIEVTGNPPYEPWTEKPVLRYPIRLQRPADLRQIAEFFRLRDLRLNEKMTKAFRDGATIGSNEVSIITVDGKNTFHILSMDLVIFADHLTYNGPETPGPLWSWFHRDFALLLKRIQSSDIKVEAKKRTPK